MQCKYLYYSCDSWCIQIFSKIQWHETNATCVWVALVSLAHFRTYNMVVLRVLPRALASSIPGLRMGDRRFYALMTSEFISSLPISSLSFTLISTTLRPKIHRIKQRNYEWPSQPSQYYLTSMICVVWDRKYLNTPNLSHPIALDGTESFQILIILVLYRAGVLENILLAWQFSGQVLIDLLLTVNCYSHLK